jgi:hypothetical protein
VGSLLARATAKNEPVVSVPLANEALSAAAGWDKIAHLGYFPGAASLRLPFWDQLRYIWNTRLGIRDGHWYRLIRRTPGYQVLEAMFRQITYLWATIQSARLLMHYQYKDAR